MAEQDPRPALTPQSASPLAIHSSEPQTRHHCLRCLACCFRSTTKRVMKALRGGLGFTGDASTPRQHFPMVNLFNIFKESSVSQSQIQTRYFHGVNVPSKGDRRQLHRSESMYFCCQRQTSLRSHPPIRPNVRQLPEAARGS